MKEPRYQRAQIDQAIARSAQYEDGYRKRRYALLEEQIAIDRDERIEALLRQGQQIAVLRGGPAGFWDCRDLVACDFPSDASINAFVE